MTFIAKECLRNLYIVFVLLCLIYSCKSSKDIQVLQDYKDDPKDKLFQANPGEN